MAEDSFSAGDEMTVTVSLAAPTPSLRVKVKTLVPLFKNGKEVPVGTELEMDAATAQRHKDVGDVEIL